MKEIVANDMSRISDLIMDDCADGKTVCAVFFYNEMEALIRSLLEYPDVCINSISITPPSWNGYTKEYILTMDENYDIDVEPAWREKNKYHDAGYVSFFANVLYIDGDACSSIIRACEEDPVIFQVNIEDDGGYCDCQDCRKRLGNILADIIVDIAHDIDIEIEEDDDDEYADEDDEVLEFIDRRFFDACEIWENENCYYFALILKDRFPDGAIVYDVIDGHFMFRRDGVFYDHTGIVHPDGYIVDWDDFDEYDSIQKKRIVRDCLK